MKINGVKIGDVFKYGKTSICEVADIRQIVSMKTNEIAGYQCIAVSTNGLARNLFEVPFSTVLRNKIQP
jgi:hypothetical protein